MSNDNYPDNIRDFNNHPGSPFFVEELVQCVECGESIPEDASHYEVEIGINDDTYICETCHETVGHEYAVII